MREPRGQDLRVSWAGGDLSATAAADDMLNEYNEHNERNERNDNDDAAVDSSEHKVNVVALSSAGTGIGGNDDGNDDGGGCGDGDGGDGDGDDASADDNEYNGGTTPAAAGTVAGDAAVDPLPVTDEQVKQAELKIQELVEALNNLAAPETEEALRLQAQIQELQTVIFLAPVTSVQQLYRRIDTDRSNSISFKEMTEYLEVQCGSTALTTNEGEHDAGQGTNRTCVYIHTYIESIVSA